MGYVERVEVVDIAVYVFVEVVEYMTLKRIRGFHDERVKIKPPYPAYVVSLSDRSWDEL